MVFSVPKLRAGRILAAADLFDRFGPDIRLSTPTQIVRRFYRVAVFTHVFPSRSETFVLDHIIRLADLGHDVSVCALRAPDSTSPPALDETHGRSILTVHPSKPKGRLLRFARAAAILGQADQHQRRVLWRSLDAFRYGRDAWNLTLFYWSACLVDRPAFDIIHCHFGPVGRLAASLREIGAIQGPLVTAFHGVDVSAYVRHDPQYYDRLFARGDLFFPVSVFWAERLRELGAAQSKIRVHRMGTDLAQFEFRPPRSPATAPYRLLIVGRLVEKKGTELALRAVTLLRDGGSDVRCDVVGDGPLRDWLEALNDELGLGPRVKFHGWQSSTRVAEMMAAADALLAPSTTDRRGDQEGIPVTLMEAMATGLPVVSTRHSGIPELIEDGVSGLLAGEGDVAALAACIRRLIEEPGLADRLAVAARKKVEADHDNTVLTARLVELYDEVTANRHNNTSARST